MMSAAYKERQDVMPLASGDSDKSGIYYTDHECIVDYFKDAPEIDLIDEWLTEQARNAFDAEILAISGRNVAENISSVEEKFRRLQERWKEETYAMSSLHDMFLNEAYQSIIGLGPAVLPYILRETNRNPDHWYWALRAITGESPVPDSLFGDVDAMSRCWVNWGRMNGLI